MLSAKLGAWSKTAFFSSLGAVKNLPSNVKMASLSGRTLIRAGDSSALTFRGIISNNEIFIDDDNDSDRCSKVEKQIIRELF